MAYQLVVYKKNSYRQLKIWNQSRYLTSSIILICPSVTKVTNSSRGAGMPNFTIFLILVSRLLPIPMQLIQTLMRSGSVHAQHSNVNNNNLRACSCLQYWCSQGGHISPGGGCIGLHYQVLVESDAPHGLSPPTPVQPHKRSAPLASQHYQLSWLDTGSLR